MLTVKVKRKLTCPRHPKFNPEQGEGAIRGGCVACWAICDVYFKALQLTEFIRRAESIIGIPPAPQPRVGTNAEL